LLDAVLATPKLSAVMAVLFVSLSIPILVFILISDDHRISAAIFATLREEAAKTRVATIDRVPNLLVASWCFADPICRLKICNFSLIGFSVVPQPGKPHL
jgi:hypothetical protein